MKIKTSQAMELAPTIAAAKLAKMGTADKLALIKAARELKRVADGADAYLRDMAERLKPDDKFQEKYQRLLKWQNEGEATDIPEEERQELNRYFSEFNSACEQGIREKRAEEVTLDCAPLTEEAFAAFCDSNDFDVNTCMALEEVLVEGKETAK